jgi:hypothetical protein
MFTIIAKAKKMGVPRIRSRDIYKKSAKAILKDYKKGLSVAKLKDKHGFSRKWIDKIILGAGLSIRGSGTYHNLPYDKTFFSRIDSHEKAYWLGFIGADGNLHKNWLSICTKDFGHLDKFKKAISGGQRVTRSKKGYYRFGIKDIRLAKQVNRLGIFDRKSLVYPFPTSQQVPKKYLNSYLLGYFDGDGCITYSKTNGRICWQFSILAAPSFAKNCMSHFCRQFGFRPTKLYKHATCEMYTVCFGGTAANRVKIIYDYLYRDVPKDVPLRRKRSIFSYLLNSCPTSVKASKYYGVTKKKTDRLWTAQKRVAKGKTIRLGYFKREIDAAKAVDKFMKSHKLHLDKLNFP